VGYVPTDNLPSDTPRGLEIQSAPTHWRFDRPHKPRRCVLCWVERLAVALGVAHYEDDPPRPQRPANTDWHPERLPQDPDRSA
jgi:hypothetical protein